MAGLAPAFHIRPYYKGGSKPRPTFHFKKEVNNYDYGSNKAVCTDFYDA